MTTTLVAAGGTPPVKFQKKPREDIELNLTPLIDVVFLLLIFFMVSTTFQKESEITLQLPSATQEPMDATPDSIELVINAAGRFYINDREVVKSDGPSLQAATGGAGEWSTGHPPDYPR